MGSKFSHDGEETFSPEYGGILWKPRLNNWLEEHEFDLKPVFYSEDDKPAMQVTQDNTFIFLNSFVDELDCIVIAYDEDIDEDGDQTGTYLFRDSYEDEFQDICGIVGKWATSTMTLYPLEQIVDMYEELHQTPDTLPDDWN